MNNNDRFGGKAMQIYSQEKNDADNITNNKYKNILFFMVYNYNY